MVNFYEIDIRMRTSSKEMAEKFAQVHNLKPEDIKWKCCDGFEYHRNDCVNWVLPH